MPDATHYLQFAHPAALWLLLLAPLVAWLLHRADRKRREAVEAFSSPALAGRLMLGVWHDGARARAGALVLALACLAVAAAAPRLGQHLERMQRKGADILVAMDTSSSMSAEDAEPSRLEAAKREIQGLIARLQGDRIGLITFADDAFLYCPLTADYDAASMFVESIDARVTSGAGTALAAALRESARAFAAGEGEEKVVVLVSDGEDWGQGAREAAQALAAKGVRIYAIGIGTEAGAPVPLQDAEGKAVGVRKEDGKVVVTRLHADELRQIASLGRGRYFDGGASDLGAAAVYSRVSALGGARRGYYTFRTYAERFQWPLAIALLLLAVEFVIGLQPARRRAAPAPAAGLATVILLCFVLGSGFSFFRTAAGFCQAANRLFHQSKFAEAFERYARALQLEPDDPLLHLNSGDALYKQGKFAEAREEYAKAAAGAPPRLGSAAHFNSGNAFLSEKNLESAIDEYKNALRCDSSNALAKRNLELALKAKQQPQQQPQNQQNQNQQNRNQQQSKPQPQKPDQKPPPQPPQQKQGPQQQPAQPRQAQATPMSPEEARALLRQAQYEDAKLRREIVRPVPPSKQKTGKEW